MYESAMHPIAAAKCWLVPILFSIYYNMSFQLFFLFRALLGLHQLRSKIIRAVINLRP